MLNCNPGALDGVTKTRIDGPRAKTIAFLRDFVVATRKVAPFSPRRIASISVFPQATAGRDATRRHALIMPDPA
jgi:hypothetical protein